MESHNKKVYINPNFKASQRSSEKPKPAMHVNPAFTLQHHVVSTSQNPRIHVNPIFIKAAHHSQQVTSSVKENEPSDTRNCVRNGTTPESTSKSRYSLIRHERQRPIKKDIPVRVKSTIAITKYKSVLVNDVKKEISGIHTSNFNIQLNNSKSKVCGSEKYNNKFKFTRDTSASAVQNLTTVTPKTTVQRSLASNKKFPVAGNKYNYCKGSIGKLKKNNIPCPLYRKFGQCLRKARGHCDYLHDKKHVSLCRKFLKGSCHNVDCLFSHDLTSKKMPTCQFYLKGMCSKENCQYLHVKLNENTKICTDFLKGYCEKGSECLKRHINRCPDLENNGICKKKQCPYPHKKKLNKESTFDKSSVTAANIEINAPDRTKNIEQESTKDGRYYKDNMNSSVSNCDIKPSRCKIGTLPSFIKL